MNQGVYLILNLQNGKHYIGSACHFEKRWKNHLKDLKAGRHHSLKLQRGWDKYGEKGFRFDIIELVEKQEELIDREQYWVDSTSPFYNILRKAGSALGYRHTDEAKEKNRKSAIKQYASLTAQQKLDRAKAHSLRLTGKTASEETKLKMSKAKLGKTVHENSQKNLIPMSKKINELSVQACSKYYKVTDPVGLTYNIKNLSKFCRDMGLSQSHMSAVANGKKRHHKNWICIHSDDFVQ